MNESKKTPTKIKSKGNLLSIVVVVLIGINIFFIYKVDQINKIVTQQNEIIEAMETKQAEDDLYLRNWIAEVHNRALSNSRTLESFSNYVEISLSNLQTDIYFNEEKISSLEYCIDEIEFSIFTFRSYSSFRSFLLVGC
jgi:hypothetical protein